MQPSPKSPGSYPSGTGGLINVALRKQSSDRVLRAPWVDSNGWAVRLAAALHPDSVIWVDAAPKEPGLSRQSYLVAIADAASRGGRWIISLDSELAAGIAGQKPPALETWKSISRAAGFFVTHEAWSEYLPEAVVGIISDFSGQNEYLTHELLNLLDRTNEQYRIILKAKVSVSSFRGLKSVLYVDADPPAPDVRKQILAFAEGGGMLITGPKWGQIPAGAGGH